MDPVAFLKELLAIPSPSGEEEAVARYLVEQMGALGFRARRDAVGNVHGVVGGPAAERTIVLMGHIDTVPGEIPIRQEGSRLYGRGAVDAKGSLAAFVLAAARLAPRLDRTRILVVGVVEEETYSLGAHHLANTLPAPYCTIVGEPSDWEGVTLGYKGMLSFDYRREQPGSHGAGAHPGPAEQAVDLWNHLMTYSTEYNDGRSGHFDTLDPALSSLRTFGDGLREGVEMSIALRLPPGLPASDLEDDIRSRCNGADLQFHFSAASFEAEKNTPLVRAMLRAIRAQGGRPRFKLKTGTADMNIVGPVWGCPIVAYGPGDSSLDHTPEEHVDVEEYFRTIDVLTTALETLDGR